MMTAAIVINFKGDKNLKSFLGCDYSIKLFVMNNFAGDCAERSPEKLATLIA